MFSVERMAPLWQLCERGDLEGVVEALAQVEEAVVEEALRKLTKVVVNVIEESQLNQLFHDVGKACRATS